MSKVMAKAESSGYVRSDRELVSTALRAYSASHLSDVRTAVIRGCDADTMRDMLTEAVRCIELARDPNY